MRKRGGSTAAIELKRPLGPVSIENAYHSDETFRALADMAPTIVWMAAPDGTITYASEQWFRFCGIDPVRNARQWPELVLHPDDRERCLAAWTAALQTGKDYEIEVRNRRFDGVFRWCLTRAKAQRDANGKIVRWFGTTTDIDHHKRTEAALRDSQAQLRAQLADTELLWRLSAAMAEPQSIQDLYEVILDAAAGIMRSDFASMQMFHSEGHRPGELQLIAHRGYPADAVAMWEWVRVDHATTCGESLRSGRRVIVRDVENCDYMAGSKDLDTYRQIGVRSVQSTPLRARNGKVLGMVSTSWRHMHEPSERDLRLFDILARQAADVIERARADAALRESEQKFSKLFEKAAMVVVLAKMPGGEMVDVNESFEAVFGFTKQEVIGKTSQELGINQDTEMRQQTVASLKADGFIRDQEMRLYTKSGETVDCLVNIVLMAFGEEHYVLSTLQDITKRKRAEDMQQLLLSELNHRVKNMLATIQAIAQQTLRHTREPEDFVASFSGRIQSLGRVHSLLTEATWRGAALKELIRDQLVLGAVDETRFIVEGPAVNLPPQTALHLALMLHELGTNSIKYGALKRPNGTVNIDWTIEDNKLRLNWTEHGVPDIREPSERGFGLTLIERSAAGQGGAAEATVGNDGLAWAITLPLENS